MVLIRAWFRNGFLVRKGYARMFSWLRRRGDVAEDFAASELEKQGCQILARNLAIGGGELDIVAARGNLLLFVEVKARKGNAFGSAAEALTADKAAKLARAAAKYLASRKHDGEARVDLAAVALGADGSPQSVEFFEDCLDVASALAGKRWQR